MLKPRVGKLPAAVAFQNLLQFDFPTHLVYIDKHAMCLDATWAYIAFF